MTVEGVQAAEVSVGLRLSCRAGWDFAAAKPYLEEAIAGYFKELAESWADEEEPLVVRISGIESRVLALAGILRQYREFQAVCRMEQPMTPSQRLRAWTTSSASFTSTRRTAKPITARERGWLTAKPSICSFCPMS